MTAALQTRKLMKKFGGFVATNDVSLSIAAEARHAPIGPNGAGKTVLINLPTGFLEPTSGSVILNGQDVARRPQHQRVKPGLARTFQINRLFADLTVLESVTLAVCERSDRSARFWKPVGAHTAAIDEAADLLARLRLIEIALALAAHPSVLLDEPAAGVPTGESRELFETIAQLPEDVTIVLIEHDVDPVFRFADRISLLVSGAVATDGMAEAIANDPLIKVGYLREAAHG